MAQKAISWMEQLPEEISTGEEDLERLALPPDGTILRVSPWRRQVLWLPAVIFAGLAVSILAYSLHSSHPAVALASVGYGLGAVLSGRAAISGIILEPAGIKARSIWRTYRWSWDEIEYFELKDRGETPRLRIHLQNGKTRGFLGFFARSPEQETRGRALFNALQTRLETGKREAAEKRAELDS